MSHFGILSFGGAGHINPLLCLSRRLVDRGHRVTFFHSPELADVIQQHGIQFTAVGSELPDRQASTHPVSGLAAVRYRLERVACDMERFLHEAPAVIRTAGVDALIVDEIALAGPTIAEMLRLPYFIISTSIPHNFGWSAPRRIMPPLSWLERLQRSLLEISVVRMRGPVRARLNRFRRQHGLDAIHTTQTQWPALAHMTQIPQCMDRPRGGLPANFYYTGPFVDDTTRPTMAFPWSRLDGRPIVYASLGTTLKGGTAAFEYIAAACEGLGVQLVISLGGRRDPEIFGDLPGDPLVVRNAPQLELLQRAEIVITHAGPNTAFESLMHGKPMIAIPKSFDQPAIAVRLESLGVAEVVSHKNLSPQRIRAALLKLLTSDRYHRRAQVLQQELLLQDGLQRAASILEEKMQGIGNEAVETLDVSARQRDACVTSI